MSSILIAHMLMVVIGVPFIAITKPEVSLQPALYIILLGIFQLGVPYVLLGLASGTARLWPAPCWVLWNRS
jgi:hypothetical protein